MPPDYTKTIARWFVNLGPWKMRACAASKWGWTLKNRDKVNCHCNSLMLIGWPAALAGGVGALAGFGLRAGALARGWELPHYRKS
jgi:hypothetical protein